MKTVLVSLQKVLLWSNLQVNKHWSAEPGGTAYTVALQDHMTSATGIVG
uniref:Uncharacterized protein n=1 Tax=Anguilla anguilla TaxID=7936 RepID=A0A0E9W138_ANGAN